MIAAGVLISKNKHKTSEKKTTRKEKKSKLKVRNEKKKKTHSIPIKYLFKAVHAFWL